jgi:hypothetical protein
MKISRRVIIRDMAIHILLVRLALLHKRRDADESAWYNDKIVSDDDLLSPATKSGRSFYTSLGHSSSSMSASVVGDKADLLAWKDEVFIKHIFGGLQWVLESGSRQA